MVSWGSTLHAVEEAIEKLGRDDVALLRFSWVYPLNPGTKRFFEGKTVIVVENNVTGQFADLLRKELGVEIHHRVLKYDGRPFSVEEVFDALKEVIE